MTAPDRMQSWIQTFLEAQAAELDAATNTRLAYGRDLLAFADWLERRKLSFATATQGHIESYLIDCEAEGLAKSTRARRLSAIKQLYRFAFEEGWRDLNPAIQIKGPGKSKRLPKTLSADDVTRLIEAAKSTPRDKIRNGCLMELLYATGMRVTELVSLPVSAARGDPRMLLVRGKGGKERMVPVSSRALTAVAAYGAHLPAGTKLLFPSGKSHLSRIRLYQIVKELAAEAEAAADFEIAELFDEMGAAAGDDE